jgi:hypothetical protein
MICCLGLVDFLTLLWCGVWPSLMLRSVVGILRHSTIHDAQVHLELTVAQPVMLILVQSSHLLLSQ